MLEGQLLEADGDIDGAVAAYVRAVLPSEAVRVLMSVSRNGEAGELLWESLGDGVEDPSSLTGSARATAHRAALCFRLDGQEGRAAAILGALGDQQSATPSSAAPSSTAPWSAAPSSTAPSSTAPWSTAPWSTAPSSTAPSSTATSRSDAATTLGTASSVPSRIVGRTGEAAAAGASHTVQSPSLADSQSGRLGNGAVPSTPSLRINPRVPTDPDQLPAAVGDGDAPLPLAPGTFGAGRQDAATTLRSREMALRSFVASGHFGRAGRVAWDLGRHELAAKLFYRGQMPFEAAACLKQMGRVAEALAMARRVTPQSPRYRRAAALVIELSLAMGSFDFDLDRFLSAFARTAPEELAEIEPALGLAQLYFGNGFAIAALPLIERCLSLDPEHGGALRLAETIEQSGAAEGRSSRKSTPVPPKKSSLPDLPALDSIGKKPQGIDRK